MIQARLATVCGKDRFLIPAPVVTGIRITDMKGTTHPEFWDGLVDTGADRTAVPLAVCHDLGLAARGWTRTRGFDRQARPREVPLYYVRLGTEGAGDSLLLACGVERSSVLLGRDFLSGLVLVVDGVHSRWQAGRPTFWTRLALRLMAFR